MNNFCVTRLPGQGAVTVTRMRNLTDMEMNVLIGVLCECEFEQHIHQSQIQSPNYEQSPKTSTPQ